MKTFKQFIENSNFDDLPFELAFRKEFGVSYQQAQDLVAWLRGVKDWNYLDQVTRDLLVSHWPAEKIDKHPGMAYDDFIMDEITSLFHTKYDLDARELI